MKTTVTATAEAITRELDKLSESELYTLSLPELDAAFADGMDSIAGGKRLGARVIRAWYEGHGLSVEDICGRIVRIFLSRERDAANQLTFNNSIPGILTNALKPFLGASYKIRVTKKYQLERKDRLNNWSRPVSFDATTGEPVSWWNVDLAVILTAKTDTSPDITMKGEHCPESAPAPAPVIPEVSASRAEAERLGKWADGDMTALLVEMAERNPRAWREASRQIELEQNKRRTLAFGTMRDRLLAVVASVPESRYSVPGGNPDNLTIAELEMAPATKKNPRRRTGKRAA